VVMSNVKALEIGYVMKRQTHRRRLLHNERMG